MAKITLSLTASFVGGDIGAANQTSSFSETPDASAVIAFKNAQIVGDGAKEDVNLQDINLGERHRVTLTNKDATNFVNVYIRKDVTPTDTLIGPLYPGEPMSVPLGPQTAGYPKLVMQADTANCIVEVVAWEAKRASA